MARHDELEGFYQPTYPAPYPGRSHQLGADCDQPAREHIIEALSDLEHGGGRACIELLNYIHVLSDYFIYPGIHPHTLSHNF
jgi:hypothetical protein